MWACENGEFSWKLNKNYLKQDGTTKMLKIDFLFFLVEED